MVLVKNCDKTMLINKFLDKILEEIQYNVFYITGPIQASTDPNLLCLTLR